MIMVSRDWAKRHRDQHEAGKKGADTSLPQDTTDRFAAEFERAVKARGAAAKEKFDEQENKRKAARSARYERRR